MDIKNSVYSYQYDELTSEELSSSDRTNVKSAEIIESSKEYASALAGAAAVATTSSSTSQPQMPQFKLLMVQRKNETADFKNLIVTCALVIVSLGLVANLLFNLLVVCRKRKRQTTTTILMFSMCTIYSIYLCFYCLKVSVYFSGDSITKFHMYDTIDNWIYGSFLCKIISGLPFCCKLISRLSILTLTIKRLLCLFICNCSTNTSNESKESSQVDSDDIDSENTKLNEINHIKMSSKSNKKCCNRIHVLAKSFEWPILIMVIIFTWVISLCVTLPIFNSYKLNEPTQSSFHTNICNSIFRFPEDITYVSRLFFSYMIYSFIIPCVLIGIFLMSLTVLQSNICFKKIRLNEIQTTTSSTSSSSSSSSFDDLSNSQCSRSKQNNLLIWLMFAIHLITTLPQELYRYSQLKIDFNDENILDAYLTNSLIQPILKAKPYYAFQLLYVSEFTLMPLMFLLFYMCSLKRHRPTRSESDSDLPNKPGHFTESNAFKFMRACFYDAELAKSNNSQRLFLNFVAATSAIARPNSINSSSTKKSTPILMINDENGKQTDNSNTNCDALLPTALYNRENILMNNNSITNANSNAANFASKLRPTPFELADQANLVHIIQHPSWRINIKQQPNSPTHDNSSLQQQQQQQQQHRSII